MKEDWIESELGEILTIERGGSPRPIKEFLTQEMDGINWIKIGDATNSGKYILETIQKIKPSGLKRSREVFPGDLLLSNSMSFGKPYIMGISGAIHDGWLVIRDNKYLNKDYLYYALSSPTTYNQFSKKAKGSTVKNLNIDIVSNVNIKIYPLPIQKSLVKKIEALFSSLDSGIADLKKAQDQLVIYRQAVLKKAFEGELTKEWREKQSDLPSADELLKQIIEEKGKLKGKSNKISILSKDEILDLFVLPKKWKWASTDHFATNESNAICAGPFGTIFKAKDFRKTGIPIIFLRHVKPNNYNTRKPGFMDKAIWKNIFQSYSVFGGELLITKLGEPPGVCAIYPEGIGPAMVTPDVIKMSVNESFSSKKYLMYYFNSVLSRRQYEKAAFGTTRLRVTIPIFRKLPIPFCSLKEQNQIVKEIENRLSVCDKVEESIKENLIKAQALRQSILKKAFEGTLLSRDEIAICKADKDYESASVLLERIKKEKK